MALLLAYGAGDGYLHQEAVEARRAFRLATEMVMRKDDIKERDIEG